MGKHTQKLFHNKNSSSDTLNTFHKHAPVFIIRKQLSVNFVLRGNTFAS